MADDLYLIWSEEHGAWWKPHQHGYTRSMKEAGRYNRDIADKIVASANITGTFHEVPVRASVVISQACELPGPPP